LPSLCLRDAGRVILHANTRSFFLPFSKNSSIQAPLLALRRSLSVDAVILDAMDLASFYFGAFLAIFCFTQAKIVQQTRIIWRRTRSIANAYLWMIWVEAWVNFIWAVKTFLYLNGVIPGRSVPIP
jgi:hypothetical protein